MAAIPLKEYIPDDHIRSLNQQYNELSSEDIPSFYKETKLLRVAPDVN